MADHVSDKVVVITGASSGIGRATALLLASRGARLMLGARRGERLRFLCREIAETVGEADFRVTDVRRQPDVAALIAAAIERYGRIDVLINNAADTRLGPLIDGRTDDWSDQIDTNLKGPLYGIAAALPHMIQQGSGHLITVASTLAFAVMKTSAVYSATKFALRAISEGVRVEAGPPVRSTLILPGAVATEVKTTVPYHLPAGAIARAILYAIDQPNDVDVNELVVRPIDQPH